MPAKHISPGANTSNPLCNCAHALTNIYSQCKHLEPPFELPPCPQNTFHLAPTPENPFATAAIPSKHISPSANTSNPHFTCPHALKTYFTQCQHLKPPLQLPPCPQNTFHLVKTPKIPSSTAPMLAKHISPSANTLNPLFNCPHALKTYFTQCQHLKPLFNCPHARKTHFTRRQHLKPPFQLPACPKIRFHPVPTPHTPFATASMPSKNISTSANTPNTLCNCTHALQTHFIQCKHIKPAFQLPPCPQNTFHPVPTPQTPFSPAPSSSKFISPSENTSNPLFNCPHALKTHFT